MEEERAGLRQQKILNTYKEEEKKEEEIKKERGKKEKEIER